MTSLDTIRAHVNSFNAAQAAEVFLSPHIATELLNGATRDAGPSMWIVNRSDVFDETLAMMESHPIADMARRAAEKLMRRRHPNSTMIPPALEMQIAEIHDSSVEDILGHPLAPWDAIHFFATATNAAHRASAALSCTRRLLEYPPDAASEKKWLGKLLTTFADRLINDTSPYVRAYAARIPLWDRDVITTAMTSESDPAVMGRLLQHPKTPASAVESAITDRSREVFDNGHVQTIAALDSRLDRDLRRTVIGEISNLENFISAIHQWYLEREN